MPPKIVLTEELKTAIKEGDLNVWVYDSDGVLVLGKAVNITEFKESYLLELKILKQELESEH